MLVGMLLIASKPGRWTTNMKNRTYKWPILSRPWFPAHGKDSAKVHERTEPNLRTCSKHNRLHLRSLLKIYLDSLEPTSTSSTVSCLGVSLSPYPYIMPNTAARGTFHSQLPTHFTNSTSIKAPWPPCGCHSALTILFKEPTLHRSLGFTICHTWKQYWTLETRRRTTRPGMLPMGTMRCSPCEERCFVLKPYGLEHYIVQENTINWGHNSSNVKRLSY